MEVWGDIGVLGSIEYRYKAEPRPWLFGGFLDMGSGWYHNDFSEAASEGAVGVFAAYVIPDAFSERTSGDFELIRVDVAVPVATRGPLARRDGRRSAQVWARTGLLF